jgi:hypothetical protein
MNRGHQIDPLALFIIASRFFGFRIKGFASRGSQRVFSKIVSELRPQKFSTSTAFQVSLSSQRIGFLNVRLIINQVPWTTVARGA